jgi:hypothetical protein
MLDFFVDDIEEITGIQVQPQFNKKGRRHPVHHPVGRRVRRPGHLHLHGLHAAVPLPEGEIRSDITWSTYASEGGNFGFFTSHETMKRLNSKMYAEAKRLGVKWILGGECGHMWRVISQYMDTMNGPADFLEVPVNPITGTKFENAKSTKMVHISEFTADLIKHGKLELDPSRNDNKVITFHDSCNPARGMGMFDEPRYVIKTWPTTFTRCRPTPSASRPSAAAAGGPQRRRGHGTAHGRRLSPGQCGQVCPRETFGVNMLATICAIDRAALPASMEYWVPEVDVTG